MRLWCSREKSSHNTNGIPRPLMPRRRRSSQHITCCLTSSTQPWVDMRIAQVSTLSAPVTEESTGSVEAWLWLLTRELVRAGHDVTVFATANSQVPEGAQLIATSPGPYGAN